VLASIRRKEAWRRAESPRSLGAAAGGPVRGREGSAAVSFSISQGATAMNLILFEDDAFKTLRPMSYSRPVFYLRVGAFTAAERAALQFPEWTPHYLCRPYLVPAMIRSTGGIKINQVPEGQCVFLNGAVMADGPSMAETIEAVPLGSAVVSDGRLLAAKLEEGPAGELFEHILNLLAGGGEDASASGPSGESVKSLGIDVAEVSVPLARNTWNLIEGTEELLPLDWSVFSGRKSSSEVSVSPAAVLVNEDSLYLGSGVKIEAGAVIDASEGPVMLDEGSKIMSHSVVYGPCYVGKNTLIKASAKIYGPCSFGPVCKLGGEIAESVVIGYSNKQHDGFLGHAYVGEWVNLGAGTEVSDLNNNYGPIRTWVNGTMVDSGSVFVGPTIGDHSKTGINSMLNSGTVIGFCCNIFGSDYLPKFVPSFSWGGRHTLVEHKREKAFDTAVRMTARRKVELDEVDRALFDKIYELSRFEREGHHT